MGRRRGLRQGPRTPRRASWPARCRTRRGELAAKIAARDKLSKWSQVSLPGDRLLQNAIDWGKQNLADLTQTASNLQIRWTNQGKQFPPPLGTVAHARWFGAGFPDYPWIFATDGEYTNFAAVALGQFDVAEDHLRALRDISDILNDRSGIVVHETVSDGSIWFGHDSQTTAADGTKTNDFNTRRDDQVPERGRARLALDRRQPLPRRDVRLRQAQPAGRRPAASTSTTTAGPRARATSSGRAWGPRSSTTASTTSARCYDLADMARSKHDARHRGVGDEARPQAAARSSRARGGTRAAQQYADSLINPGNAQDFQKHWIGQVPMEAELNQRRRGHPGRRLRRATGRPRWPARENSCFSGDRPGSLGLFHTGCGGGAGRQGRLRDLLADDLDPGRRRGQLRAPRARASSSATPTPTRRRCSPSRRPATRPTSSPARCRRSSRRRPRSTRRSGIPPNIDRCWTCRSMFMQAWGNYGTAWSVVHQQLGVRPYLDDGALQVVPQVPPGQPSVAGSNIRLGDGSVGVFASRSGDGYTTKVDAHAPEAKHGLIGHTLPRRQPAAEIRLDGRRVRHYDVRETNRGVEVTVPVGGSGPQTLTMTTP